MVVLVALALMLAAVPFAFVVARKHRYFASILAALSVYLIGCGVSLALSSPFFAIGAMLGWYWAMFKSRDALRADDQ